MSLTPSTMRPLGTPPPDFRLPEVSSGAPVSLADFDGKPALLVMFLCRHCPYVQHVEHVLASLCEEYGRRGVGIVGISSNDAEAYPADRPESLAQQKVDAGFTFPYLHDETQEVARAYGAACTPDFFLYDGARRLVYRGQMDGSRPENGEPVSGRDLRAAMDAVLAGEPVPPEQRPSMGCNIKWRSSAR